MSERARVRSILFPVEVYCRKGSLENRLLPPEIMNLDDPLMSIIPASFCTALHSSAITS